MIIAEKLIKPKSEMDEPFYRAIKSFSESFRLYDDSLFPQRLVDLITQGEFCKLWHALRRPYSSRSNNFMGSRNYHHEARDKLFSQISFPSEEIMYVLEHANEDDNIYYNLRNDALSHPALPQRVRQYYLDKDDLDFSQCEALLRNIFTPTEFIEKVFGQWKDEGRYESDMYAILFSSAMENPNVPEAFFHLALDRKHRYYSGMLLRTAIINISFPPSLLLEASRHSEEAAMASYLHINCPLEIKARILLEMDEALREMMIEDEPLEINLDSWLNENGYDEMTLSTLTLHMKLSLVSV